MAFFDEQEALATRDRIEIDERESLAVRALIDTLIDGLRLRSRDLNEKCSRGLLSIGKGVQPFISAVAEAQTSPRGHRTRLRAVLAHLERIGVGEIQHGADVLAALLAGLRARDRDLNMKAARTICLYGGCFVNRLISEAAANEKNHAYYLRLLQVVERIGVKPGVEEFCYLMHVLATHRNEKIRYQVARVLNSFPSRSAG